MPLSQPKGRLLVLAVPCRLAQDAPAIRHVAAQTDRPNGCKRGSPWGTPFGVRRQPSGYPVVTHA